MATIRVVVMYVSHEVPDDMDLDKLEAAVTKRIESTFDCFRAHVPDHPDEEVAEPMFDLEDTKVGDRFTVKRL